MTKQAIKDMVIRWHERDAASADETARLLHISVDEVLAIIRESEHRHPSVRTTSPEFIQPPAFPD